VPPALIAVASIGISLKLILLPLGILAFLVFLLILGAFGLFSALAIISAFTWLFRLLTGTRKGRSREPARATQPDPFWRRAPLSK
jgi:hypothetical protein